MIIKLRMKKTSRNW